MLRKWTAPVATCCFAEDVDSDSDDCELPGWKAEGTNQPTIGEQLISSQETDLRMILDSFDDILSGDPGCTTLTEHRITSGTGRPVRLPPFRVPHAFRNVVYKELQEMQAAGIIKPSQSEWASPIMVVHKKDDGIRLCVDYR